MAALTATSDALAPTTKTSSPSQSSLAKAKSTVQYMISPTTSTQPGRFRTRAFLRSARYLFLFAFWRLVRYAKYAAVGAAVAAISGTAIGSIFSGAAFVLAPTGILGGAGVGLLWAVGKYGWRKATARVQGRVGAKRGKSGDPRKDERADAEGVTAQEAKAVKAEEREVRGMKADPW
ncbi:hypothetical protein LTR53_004540 [Teratosphaeriaceae sp. CCFEE 6253]|nr:hypothetical protein LTR53_004540 [Teratosphaeriaceae sp. CCFEE 6253]